MQQQVVVRTTPPGTSTNGAGRQSAHLQQMLEAHPQIIPLRGYGGDDAGADIVSIRCA